MGKKIKIIIVIGMLLGSVYSIGTLAIEKKENSLSAGKEMIYVRGIYINRLEGEILESVTLNETEKKSLKSIIKEIKNCLEIREYDKIQELYMELDILVGNIDRERVQEEILFKEEQENEIREREKKEEEQRKEWDRQREEEQKRIDEQLRLDEEKFEEIQESLEAEIRGVQVVSVSEEEILESMEKDDFESQLKVMLSKFYITKRDLEGYLDIFDRMKNAQRANDFKSAGKYAEKIKVIIDYYLKFQ